MSELYVCEEYEKPHLCEEGYRVITTLEEHDKQIRAEVIEEILNKVNSYIADMKKYFSETQDETFLCAISETQKVRNIIRDMLKEQK